MKRSRTFGFRVVLRLYGLGRRRLLLLDRLSVAVARSPRPRVQLTPQRGDFGLECRHLRREPRALGLLGIARRGPLECGLAHTCSQRRVCVCGCLRGR